ncbi:MAG: hypothetical protein AVDCRST_MAG69-809, partial [uncultured Solirubrobacteraceae bacterium]
EHSRRTHPLQRPAPSRAQRPPLGPRPAAIAAVGDRADGGGRRSRVVPRHLPARLGAPGVRLDRRGDLHRRHARAAAQPGARADRRSRGRHRRRRPARAAHRHRAVADRGDDHARYEHRRAARRRPARRHRGRRLRPSPRRARTGRTRAAAGALPRSADRGRRRARRLGGPLPARSDPARVACRAVPLRRAGTRPRRRGRRARERRCGTGAPGARSGPCRRRSTRPARGRPGHGPGIGAIGAEPARHSSRARVLRAHAERARIRGPQHARPRSPFVPLHPQPRDASRGAACRRPGSERSGSPLGAGVRGRPSRPRGRDPLARSLRGAPRDRGVRTPSRLRRGGCRRPGPLDRGRPHPRLHTRDSGRPGGSGVVRPPHRGVARPPSTHAPEVRRRL